MARNPAAQTAFGPMVQAAIEQYEPPAHRLVHDDLAMSILPAGQRAFVHAMRWPLLRRMTIAAGERAVPGSWALITCRKRFIDDKLDESLDSIDAVVILGAGMDTRAYRLARRSETPVFEVDLPVNIARKKAAVERALGPASTSVHLVALDFERDDLIGALSSHGYRIDARTLFICEGVTQYLTEDAVRATLAALADTAPGSRLVLTYVRRDFIDGVNMYDAAVLYKRFRQRQQVWKFGLNPDDVAAFIGEYGWRLVEQAGPEYYTRNYIEPLGRKLTASDLEWTAYAQSSREHPLTP
jgi:methyltransferase (TIGR00027 family)